jgi:multidrug efflux pump subunit AcrB
MGHPLNVLAGMAALAVASVLAVRRMPMDVFPVLDLPVIFVAQPHSGMDPGQV